MTHFQGTSCKWYWKVDMKLSCFTLHWPTDDLQYFKTSTNKSEILMGCKKIANPFQNDTLNSMQYQTFIENCFINAILWICFNGYVRGGGVMELQFWFIVPAPQYPQKFLSNVLQDDTKVPFSNLRITHPCFKVPNTGLFTFKRQRFSFNTYQYNSISLVPRWFPFNLLNSIFVWVELYFTVLT